MCQLLLPDKMREIWEKEGKEEKIVEKIQKILDQLVKPQRMEMKEREEKVAKEERIVAREEREEKIVVKMKKN